MSAAETVAHALREQILDGTLAPGAPLREQRLAAEHGAARHTVRAALRALEAENLVAIEANRGARVQALTAQAVTALYELRAALELEAAHLALDRHGGRLPQAVHDEARRFAALCRSEDPDWPAISRAHGDLHHALVRAARSPRIAQAHHALELETRLFLLHVRPHWTLEQLASDHLELLERLETQGPGALRAHLKASAAAVLDELDATA